MKVVEYGKGNKDIIILLHGGGLSWWNYEEVAEKLADSFHIILPILNGHFGSNTPFTSIEDNAAELITYIDENFKGRVFLIGGLSLGGQVLIETLSQRSDICEYAIIESALVIPMKYISAMIKPAYDICYPLVKKRWFSKIQFKALHIRKELFDKYYIDTANITKKDMISFLTANSKYRIRNTLAECKAKTLVVVGSKERKIMKKSAQQIAGFLPMSNLEIIKNYNHGELSINHSEEFVQKLHRLIKK